MRTEYYIYQRLVWDAEFRRSFAKDRVGTLQLTYPGYESKGHFFGSATLAGLEEEAYRRMGALHRTSKEVFPRLHNLIVTIFGNEFFELVLQLFFSHDHKSVAGRESIEILEPFDGYVVVPVIWKALDQWDTNGFEWIRAAMGYEWAIWQARRVASGWPPLEWRPPLSPGASLIEVDFDLKALLAEIKRLEIASVGPEIFKWRIKPAPGRNCLVVFPTGRDVREAVLDKESSSALREAIETGESPNDSVQAIAEQIALVLESSFLCCSREAPCLADHVGGVSGMIEPQPH